MTEWFLLVKPASDCQLKLCDSSRLGIPPACSTCKEKQSLPPFKERDSSAAGLFHELRAKRLVPVRNRADLLFLEQTFRDLLQIGPHARRKAGFHFDVGHRLTESLTTHLVAFGREKSINDLSRLAGILFEVFAAVEPGF